MSKLRNCSTSAGIAAIAIASWPGYAGTPIPVTNHSFETPAQGLCGFQKGVAPGWTGGGVWRPGSGTQCLMSFVNPPPDGQQIAFSNSGDMSQTLSATLQPSEEYRLRVDVGRRLDCCQMEGYKVQLFAGAALLAEDSSTLNPTPGTFLTSTLTANIGASHPALGQPLKIQLVRVGNGQVNFDNVRLEFGRPGPCPADIAPVGSPDGVVGPGDLAQLLSKWGSCPAPCSADLFPSGSPDGTVGPGDLGQLLSAWGQCS